VKKEFANAGNQLHRCWNPLVTHGILLDSSKFQLESTTLKNNVVLN